mgnify:CR=1 FL=1
MKNIDKKSLTLKTLNKSNVWDMQENDIFRMIEAAEKDADIKENPPLHRHNKKRIRIRRNQNRQA